MKKIIAAFKAGSVDQKDGPYSFFQNSLLFERDLNTVPMTLNDEKKKSSLEYGEHGYKHFHPWFLADLNPSSIDEYFRLIMEVLPHVDPILNREEYWFFRADINILMMWYRVSTPLFPYIYEIVCFRWYGPQTTSYLLELLLGAR